MSALTLLIGLCIVGSIAAARRVLSRASVTVSTKKKVLVSVAEVTVRDERDRDTPTEAECSEEMQYG